MINYHREYEDGAIGLYRISYKVIEFIKHKEYIEHDKFFTLMSNIIISTKF